MQPIDRASKLRSLAVAVLLLSLSSVSITLSGAGFGRSQPILEVAKEEIRVDPPDIPQAPIINGGLPLVSALTDSDWIVAYHAGNTNLDNVRTFVHINVRNGCRSPVARMGTLINRAGALCRDPVPSPDGAWVATGVLADVSDTGANNRLAVSIDGRRYLEWPALTPRPASPFGLPGEVSYLEWLPNSRQIAEVSFRKGWPGGSNILVRTRDVYRNRCRTSQISGPFGCNSRMQVFIRGDRILCSTLSDYRSGWTWPMPELVGDEEGESNEDTTSFDLWSLPLSEAGAHPFKHHLEAPQGTWLVGLDVSPNGRRIAWEVVRRLTPSSVDATIAWMLRRVRPMPSERIEVWTSSIDGSGMNIIGHIPLREPWGVMNRIRLKWLPSGSKLRFLFNKSIYTVSAN